MMILLMTIMMMIMMILISIMSFTFGKSESHCIPLHCDERTSFSPRQSDTYVGISIMMMMTVVTTIIMTMTMQIMWIWSDYLVSSYLVESVHLASESCNKQPVKIIYHKYFSIVDILEISWRTFSMAATPSCSWAERWTAVPPSPINFNFQTFAIF